MDEDQDVSTQTTLLGVVMPPPPAAAQTAVTDAYQWVVDELVRLRAEKDRIFAEIRALVAQEKRLRRAVRVLDDDA